MYDTSLGSVTAEIEALLEEKLSAKGRNLKEKIRSVGRHLPRAIKRDATYLCEAQERCRNPKSGGQYEADRVVSAYQHCVDYLEKIDRRAARSYVLTRFAAGSVVNVAIVAGLTVIVLTALDLI